jgi:hypothetical protein
MTPAELTQITREVHLSDLVDAVGETAEVTTLESQVFSQAWYLRECQLAQREAFQRSDLRHVYDDENFTIALQAGVSAYPLDRRILRIEEVLMDGRRLGFHTKSRIEEWNPNWRQMGTGQPLAFYIDNRTMRFVPTPDTTYGGRIVTLGVYRLPLNDPQWNEDFEWPGDHSDLAHWIAHRAFLVPNTILSDPNMAEYHFQAFNAAFGEPLSHKARADLLQYPDVISFAPMQTAYRGPCRANFLTEG